MDIFPDIAGRTENWDVIVMGHLKVNVYFGESYEKPPRGDPSTCTSVMVRGTERDGRPYILIIDPTIRERPEDFYFDINRRTGLRGKDVTHCFCTHHHGDHYEAMKYFPSAKWLAVPDVAALIKAGKNVFDISKLESAEGEFLPGVCAVPLPGHTGSLCGAAFAYRGKRVLAAGDAVMSKYHFDNGTTDFQNDPNLILKAAQSIRKIKDSFDIVIPGHDNIIVL
jgi:glyoxylase-like metal-dependent hydrolase (beta-lactamase superfamily II)